MAKKEVIAILLFHRTIHSKYKRNIMNNQSKQHSTTGTKLLLLPFFVLLSTLAFSKNPTPHLNECSAVAEGDNIEFADSAVKALCVANWDRNGDGELSYSEAAAVISLDDKVFKENTEITSFDELQYFTGLTETGWFVFQNCVNLVSVSLPANITEVGIDAFSGCTSLASIVIPDKVTLIHWRAFQNCTGLTTLTLGESVETIGSNAFSGCTSLSDVTFPESLVTIENNAFEKCYELTTLTIPSNVTTIGGGAFASCTNLASITIGEGAQHYGSAVFGGCNKLNAVHISSIDDWFKKTFENGESPLRVAHHLYLNDEEVKELVVPDWVTSIQSGAFRGCSSLESVNIPQSVTSIGEFAFEGCENIASIVVDAENTVYDSRENCNAIIETATATLIAGCKNSTIPEGISYIGDYAFSGCKGLETLEIPSSVVRVGLGAFSGTAFYDNLPDGVIYFGSCLYGYKGDMPSGTNIVVKEGTTCIVSGAFAWKDNLTSIVFPNSLKIIEERAFQGCNFLVGLNIPDGVTTIGNKAFYSTGSLSSVVIPASVTSLGEYVFEYSGITSAVLPECLTTIPSGLFNLCSNLTEVTIPTSVTTIGPYAFRGCSNLETIDIPNNVTTIDTYAFYNCSKLETIDIPNSVTYVGGYAFHQTPFYNNLDDGVVYIGRCLYIYKGSMPSHTNIIIKEGTVGISYNAVSWKSNLESLTIPSSVRIIGSWAFNGCDNLLSITSYVNEPSEITDDVFTVYETATLRVPAGAKKRYMATPAWNKFLNIVEMDIEPINDGQTIDFSTDIDEGTDLNGNVVGDIYYSISNEDGSYDPEEGCIVVTTPTSDETMDDLVGKDIFGEDFKDQYTGVVFKVAPGSGKVKVEAETTGSMVLKIKIGDSEPLEMELDGKQKISRPYNVTEETYVYIYGSTTASLAKGLRNVKTVTDALKIYSIEVQKDVKLGDVNKDNSITIADVTALVNIILGKDSEEPYQYDQRAADVNKDNTITIADVTALVNIILGK